MFALNMAKGQSLLPQLSGIDLWKEGERMFIFTLATLVQAIKEACQPVIPAENWANKELIQQDRMKGISEKEFSRNLANGKYKMTQTFPEPHRDPKTGQIIIENSLLYKEDLKNYDAHQVMQWVRQGKYNLSPEELKKEEERIQKEFERLYRLR